MQDDRLAGVQPAQRGEVADLRGGQFRAGAEVEAFQGGGFVDVGAAQASGHGHGVTAGDFVLAEDLQEVEVAEFAGGGLGEPGVEGFEHAGQFQGAQAVVQCNVEDGHGVLFS